MSHKKKDKTFHYPSFNKNGTGATPRRSTRLSGTPQSSQVKEIEPELQIIGRSWKPAEKLDLLKAMKKYGCSDIQKLAREVKSRSPNEIKEYLKKHVDHVRNSYFEDLNKAVRKQLEVASAQNGEENGIAPSTQNAKENAAQSCIGGAVPEVEGENVRKSSQTDGSTATNTEFEYLKLLSMMDPIMLWKHILTNNIAVQHRSDDYSNVLADMYKAFGDEIEEFNGEQMKELNVLDGPNFKELYKFFEDALNGILPAELHPANASVLNYFMCELNCFVKEEREDVEKFIKEFDGSCAFAPVSVCTNLKSSDVGTSKPVSKRTAAAALKSIAKKRKDQIIPVSDEYFEHYWRHQKIKENLNPLGVPPWMVKDMNEKIVKWMKRRYPNYRFSG